VAGSAQQRGRSDEGGTGQLGLLVGIVQAESGFMTATCRSTNAAGGDGVGAARAGGREIDAAGFSQRRLCLLDQLEKAGALKVAANNGSDGTGRAGIAAKICNRDGNAVGAGAGHFDRKLRLRREADCSAGAEHGKLTEIADHRGCFSGKA
jgi:hypothetical protein